MKQQRLVPNQWFKPVMRYDPRQRIYRVFRLQWRNGKLSFAASARPFAFHRESDEWLLTFAWMRVHFIRGNLFR
jgi:hypothetical protein